MVNVTKRHLWEFLTLGGCDFADLASFKKQYNSNIDMTEEQFAALKAADLKEIIADVIYKRDVRRHLGGDDLVDVATHVLMAIAEGYAVTTWYGPSAEVLVVGYRPDQIGFNDDHA